MRKIIVFCLVFAGFPALLPAQNQVLLKALQDELERSVASLKLENASGPYFLSYLVKDSTSLVISASSGALTANNENRSRFLRIDLRVGDYNLDNSNFASGMSGMSTMSGYRSLALDDDYDAIRRQLWLETDRVYKQAVDTLAKKKAYLQNAVRTEVVPDFTQEQKLNVSIPEPALAIPRAKWEKAVDAISKIFLKQDKIQRSRVSLEVRKISTYYINSEGTVGVEPSITSRLAITASTQAADGMPLRDFLVYTAKHPDELPAQEVIVREAQGLIDSLLKLQTAPIVEEYSGPVLFAGQAAAEVLAQGLIPNLVGRKLPLSDNPQISAMAGRMENPYLTKVNTKVIASFVSVKALPALKSYGGRPLLGSYSIDEEGVKAQDALLIEKGMLRNLLTSRAPIKGFGKSNGHARGGTATPGVIQVFSEKKSTMEDLKKLLIEKVKEEGLPFGYMVKSIMPASESTDADELDIRSLIMSQSQQNPSLINLTRPPSISRIYPDGKEEAVRGASFGSIGINGFRDLLASSDTDYVYEFQNLGGSPGTGGLLTMLLGGTGMPTADYPATVITPSFIMPGVDIKKPTGEYRKLPIVSYPDK